MKAKPKFTINTKSDLKHAVKQAGSHFFSRDTMRFFKSILHSVYGTPDGAVFVTSEMPPHGRREYKVRFWDGVAARSLKSEIAFKDDAVAEARRIAKLRRGGTKTAFSEPY